MFYFCTTNLAMGKKKLPKSSPSTVYTIGFPIGQTHGFDKTYRKNLSCRQAFSISPGLDLVDSFMMRFSLYSNRCISYKLMGAANNSCSFGAGVLI